MQPLDVTLTATRRPDLFGATLQSFHQNLFRHFPIRRFFLNIDPLWGTESDADEIERLAHQYFSDVVIRRPSTPSLAAAVKWLWAQPETDWFFHMEDDWQLLRRVREGWLRYGQRGQDTIQILLCRHSWVTRYLKRTPGLSTCPSFVRTDYAKRVGQLMNADLDTEAQVAFNKPLADFVAPLRFKWYGAPGTARTLRDTGRAWRSARGIDKTTTPAGASVWGEKVRRTAG